MPVALNTRTPTYDLAALTEQINARRQQALAQAAQMQQASNQQLGQNIGQAAQLYQRGQLQNRQEELQDRREREARQERRALHSEDAYSRSLQNLMQTRQQTDQANLEREKLGLQWHPETKAAQEKDAKAIADIQQQVATGQITQSQGRDALEQVQARIAVRQPTERPSEPFKAREETLPSGLVNVYGDPMNPNRITYNYVPPDRTTQQQNELKTAEASERFWLERASNRQLSRTERDAASNKAAFYASQADKLRSPQSTQLAPSATQFSPLEPQSPYESMLSGSMLNEPLPAGPQAERSASPQEEVIIQKGGYDFEVLDDGTKIRIGPSRIEAQALTDQQKLETSTERQLIALDKKRADDLAALNRQLADDFLDQEGYDKKIAELETDEQLIDKAVARAKTLRDKLRAGTADATPQVGTDLPGGQPLQPGWFARQGAPQDVPPAPGQAVSPTIQPDVGNAPAESRPEPVAPPPEPPSPVTQLQQARQVIAALGGRAPAALAPQEAKMLDYSRRKIETASRIDGLIKSEKDKANASDLKTVRDITIKWDGPPTEQSKDFAPFMAAARRLRLKGIDLSAGKQKPQTAQQSILEQYPPGF